jgi:acyl-ACP thioesterase
VIERSSGPDRRASLEVRVRFDEATPSGAIRTSTLLRYASDLASVDSDRRGFSRQWYLDHELAWLVRGVVLELLRPIAHGDEIVGTTQVVGARKVLARRRTEFRTADGELAAVVMVDWALISAAGSPTRIPADFAPAFAMAELNFAPIRVRSAAPADRPLDTLELAVRPQELDPMDHVNNAVYLDWAEEAIRAAELGAESAASPLDAVPRRWQLEYVSSAAAGDRAVATSWTDGPARYCRIEDAATGALFLAARLEP